MEEFAKALAQYGAVGLVAAMAFYGYMTERRENKGLRDDLVKKEREHGHELKAVAKDFSEQLNKAYLLTREREDELTERLIKNAEISAEISGRLTEKVSMLVDSVQRKALR